MGPGKIGDGALRASCGTKAKNIQMGAIAHLEKDTVLIGSRELILRNNVYKRRPAPTGNGTPMNVMSNA
jgi:hypothetical protein